MPFILEQMMGLRLRVNSTSAARGVVKAMCFGGGGSTPHLYRQSGHGTRVVKFLINIFQ
jgi:hypothetical protein